MTNLNPLLKSAKMIVIGTILQMQIINLIT